MEGLSIPDESGMRALEARKLLGEDFDVEGDIGDFEVTKNCKSLTDACEYIKEQYGVRKQN